MFSVPLQLLYDPIKGCNNPLRRNQLPLTSLLLTSRPTRTSSDTSQSLPCVEQLLTQHGSTRGPVPFLFFSGPSCCRSRDFGGTRGPRPPSDLSCYVLWSSLVMRGAGFRRKVASVSPWLPSWPSSCLLRSLQSSIPRSGCHGLVAPFGGACLPPQL